MNGVSKTIANGIRTLDLALLIPIGLLILISLAALYTSSQGDIDKVWSQVQNFSIAATLLVLVANCPHHYLVKVGMPLYIIGVVLLLMTALFGEQSNGAQRWLNLHVVRIQPSELLKLALPLALAWYFDRYEHVLRGQNFIVATCLLIVPVGLILKQPDLGTAILIGASGFFVLFFAGLSLRVLGFLAATTLVALPFGWGLLHEYQQNRILMMLDPTSDPLGAGYHTIQSTIAIGSGGFWGKGWMEGTQAQLNFLPEGSTDFVLAVIGEEFGFVGIATIFAIYAFLIARGLIISASATSAFDRLVAISITLTFFLYAFVNVGMVIGLLPVVGVPLPLVSYGGTSAVTIMLSLGVLMNIHSSRRLIQS